MKGAIDEGKEISPMFPRLHVKDAEKGGPKAPPRNKMALYEQFSIPSQSFASSGSGSLFTLPLRNCTLPTTSSHLGCGQSIKFYGSNASSVLSEKTQAYNSRKINSTKLTASHDLEHMTPAKQVTKIQQDYFINNSKNSLKTLDGEDAFITSGSVHVKSIQNGKDEEDKLARYNLNCSLKSLNSFRKVMNSPGTTELKSAQYGKSLMKDHKDVRQIDQNEEEKPLHSLNGFDDTANASSNSSIKDRNSKSMNKEQRSLKEENRNISVDSLKTLQGSNGHRYEDHVAFADKINLRDHCMEKPAMSDFQKCSGELEIGTRSSHGKRERSKDEETSKNYDALNKSSSECRFGMDISPDDVVGLIGEKQFWKTRRTIINQQRIFFMQVFELHRLIKVQRLIAGSPNLLFEDKLLLNKQPIETSSSNKLQSDFISEQPPTVFKLDSKSEKATTSEDVENNAVGKISLPFVNNNISKENNQLSNYGNHHLGNLALASADKSSNAKHSPSIVYPPPPPNQWLVPVMSPSEGLVYKPIIGPCPPNAGGIMTPLYGGCGPMSFNQGSKDVVLDPSLTTSFHQKIRLLSGSSLPQLLPPCVPSFMHRSISASSVEQMAQSNGPKNHYSSAELNSTILYQSPSNMSTQISHVMARNFSPYQSLEDNKELQISIANSPSKRMKRDELPLFPLAPTFWSSPDRDSSDEHQEHHSRVIKALPHNPKSASESAAKIFKSIQEERKFL